MYVRAVGDFQYQGGNFVSFQYIYGVSLFKNEGEIDNFSTFFIKGIACGLILVGLLAFGLVYYVRKYRFIR